METASLRDLLAAKLGLDVDSLGPSFLASVARWGLQQSGHSDLAGFIREATAGGEPWRRLVEHVVVSETWFFRDEAPFDHIVETVQTRWMGSGTAPIRVLSCPCSTGEEPYSVAIALRDAGLPSDAFTIDAADVSPTAILEAQAGAFRSRSFRGGDRVDRARYFEHDSGTRLWRLKPAIRSLVRFHVANLVSLSGLLDAQLYDIVLCRNLLIYLHTEARASVVATMRRLLTSDGVLIVGHAEPAVVREHGFAGIGNPRAFAFAKPTISGIRKRAATRAQRDGVHEHSRAVRKAQFASIGAALSQVAADRDPPREIAPTLERIRQLGDQGHTGEAIRACRDYVKRVPGSAEGYFLLGVLSGAIGHTRAAETALRQALYIEPDHAAALVHLALTYDARGDSASAARLRARASRNTSRRRGPQ